MDTSTRNAISQFFFAVALIIAVACTVYLSNLSVQHKDNIQRIQRNAADYFLKREQHLGNLTSIRGDVLYFDEQYVVLEGENQFARPDELTLKSFVVSESPLTYLCAEDLCASVARTNIAL